METQITTQARRMQRELANTPNGIDALFTKDGEYVGSIPTGMWFTEGNRPDYSIRLAGGKHSQRECQDWLDAVAANPTDPHLAMDEIHATREFA